MGEGGWSRHVTSHHLGEQLELLGVVVHASAHGASPCRVAAESGLVQGRGPLVCGRKKNGVGGDK